MNLFVIIIVLVPVAVFVGVSRNQRRRSAIRAATVELVVNDEGVRRILADGREEAVGWHELEEVEVLTAKTGPNAAAGGVVILGGGPERGCLVPIDKLEPSGLMHYLPRLTGFDTQVMLDALQARPPTRTVCWTRPS